MRRRGLPDSRDSWDRRPPRLRARSLSGGLDRRPAGYRRRRGARRRCGGRCPLQRCRARPPRRVDARRHPDRRRSVAPTARFTASTSGGGAVIERGVGDLHARQPGDQRLELEQGLEHPLGDFGLVWGIGGDELRARCQGGSDRRNLVVIGAAPGEAHQIPPGTTGWSPPARPYAPACRVRASRRGDRAPWPNAGQRARRRRAHRATTGPRNASMASTSASVCGVYPLMASRRLTWWGSTLAPGRTKGRAVMCGRQGAAADLDRHVVPVPHRTGGVDERHGDAPVEHGREVAARDRTHRSRRRSSRCHLGAAAGDPSAIKPRRRRAGHRWRVLLQGAAASEVPFVPTHHPAEAGLQGGDPRPELMAVQRQAGLEAQGVARSQPGRDDVRIEQRLPERPGRGRPLWRTPPRPRRCSRYRPPYR